MKLINSKNYSYVEKMYKGIILKYASIPKLELNEPYSSILSFKESMILCQLKHKYDKYKMDEYYKDTEYDNYSKFIKGYKSWTELYIKSSKYFSKDIDLPDQFEELSNLIIRLFRLLLNKSSIENSIYIEYCIILASVFKLLKFKFNYKKRIKILNNLNKSIDNFEVSRIVSILSTDKKWSLNFLYYLFIEDLSERIFHIHSGIENTEYIIY